MPNVLSRAVATLLLGLPVLLWSMASLAADKTDTPAKDDSESVFGLTRVWKIHLHVSAENWKTMQPAAGGFPGFGPPPPGFGPPRAPDDKPKETGRSDRAAPTPPGELKTQEDHK